MSPVPETEDQRDKLSNNGSDIEDTDIPDVIINAGMSDTDSNDNDEFEGEYMGYQALTQDYNALESEEESQTNEDVIPEQTSIESVDAVNCVDVPHDALPETQQGCSNNENLPKYMQVPDLPRPDKMELLWNQPRHMDKTLDTGQVETIRSLMSGIKLPSSSVPDWAKHLSDDQWKSEVVNKLLHPGHNQRQEVRSANNSSRQDMKNSTMGSTSVVCDLFTNEEVLSDNEIKVIKDTE